MFNTRHQLKPPKFKLLAGVGGIFAYLLSSIPLVAVTSLVAYSQHSNDADGGKQAVKDLFDSQWFLAGVLIFQCIGFFVYAIVVSKLRGSRNLRNDLGLRFTKSALWFLPVGVGLQIIGMIVSVPIHLLKNDISEQQVVSGFKDSSGLGMFVLLSLFAFIVPIVEEACFRGLFMRGLTKRVAPYMAVLISGIIFAGVHFSDPNALLGGTTLLMVGLGAGLLAMYRGRIDASICLHIGFNATTVFLILLL